MRIDPEEARKAIEQNRLRRSASTAFPSAPAREDENGVYDEAEQLPERGERGQFTSASGRDAASKRWSMPRKKGMDAVGDVGIYPGFGFLKPLEGPDDYDNLDVRSLADHELARILGSEATPPVVKVQAARAVFARSGPVVGNSATAELHELRDELAQLPVEQRLDYLCEATDVRWLGSSIDPR